MKNELLKIGPFTVYGYGLMIAVGILAAYFTGERRAKKRGLPYEHVFNLVVWCVLGGFLGAKILYWITEWKSIVANPGFLGDTLTDGFVVFGGIIGGILTSYVYCRIKNLDFLRFFDTLMPSVALAQGFGRIGCLLAGCCYGRETTSRFGVVFPEGGLAPAGVKLIPTQLISSAGDFLIMIVLLLYYRKNKKDGTPGNVGFLYMLLYGVGRFLVEFLRNDNRGGAWMFSTSQWISIVIVAGGIVLYLVNKKRHKR